MCVLKWKLENWRWYWCTEVGTRTFGHTYVCLLAPRRVTWLCNATRKALSLLEHTLLPSIRLYSTLYSTLYSLYSTLCFYISESSRTMQQNMQFYRCLFFLSFFGYEHPTKGLPVLIVQSQWLIWGPINVHIFELCRDCNALRHTVTRRSTL